MYDKKLEYQIIKLLSENKHISLKIREIVQKIRLKKHKHKDLIDTLFKLTKENKIFLKNRKYSFSQNIDQIKLLS